MTDSAYEEIPAEDEDSDMDDYAPMSKEEYERGPQSERVRELLAMRNARLDAEYAAARPSLIEYYRSGGVPDSQPMRALYDSLSPVADTTEPPPIKGGPGSGFHGHEGRPGQRGGSVDDGIPNKEEDGGGGSNAGSLSFAPRNTQAILAVMTGESRADKAPVSSERISELRGMMNTNQISAEYERGNISPQEVLALTGDNLRASLARGVNRASAFDSATFGFSRTYIAALTDSVQGDLGALASPAFRETFAAQFPGMAFNSLGDIIPPNGAGSIRDYFTVTSDAFARLAAGGMLDNVPPYLSPVRFAAMVNDKENLAPALLAAHDAGAISDTTYSTLIGQMNDDLTSTYSELRESEISSTAAENIYAASNQLESNAGYALERNEEALRTDMAQARLLAEMSVTRPSPRVAKVEDGQPPRVGSVKIEITGSREYVGVGATPQQIEALAAQIGTGPIDTVGILDIGHAGDAEQSLTLALFRKSNDPSGHEKTALAHASLTARSGFDDVEPSLVLNSLSIDEKYQAMGISKDLLDVVIGYADASGIKNLRVFADITIGKYAWTKYGFEYPDKYGAREATRKFVEWANNKNIAEPADGWPTFNSPYDVATYDIPGIRIAGENIVNAAVRADEQMHVGKAFMLDDLGHGPWDGRIDIEAFRAMAEAYKQANATKSFFVKGGPGSGFFNHEGRPGERGGSVDDGIPNKEEERGGDALSFAPRDTQSALALETDAPTNETPDGSDSQPKMGNLHLDINGETNSDNGFTGVGASKNELKALMSRVNMGDFQSVNGTLIIRHGKGDEGEDIQKVYLGLRDGEKPIGKAVIVARELRDGNMETYLDTMTVNPEYQARGVSKGLFDVVAGYAEACSSEKISVIADITIGRYSWAMYGFEYANDAKASEITTRFAQWTEKRGIAAPAGGWPKILSPYGYATLDVPGVLIEGSTVKNKDVRPDEQMRVGKAFMLDDKTNGGHGDWAGTISIDRFKEMNEAYKQKMAKRA